MLKKFDRMHLVKDEITATPKGAMIGGENADAKH